MSRSPGHPVVQQPIRGNSARALWRLFSPDVVRDLARPNGGKKARGLFEAAWPLYHAAGHMTLADAYNSVFASLADGGAAQYAYRNAIVQRTLLSKYGKPRNRVFFEFRAGAAKLDSLVINGSMHAIEIKTDLDHFRRLGSQLYEYKRRFKNVWIFGSERNIGALERLVDPSVGLLKLRRNRSLTVVRNATAHVNDLDAAAILESLRRDEYVALLESFGFSPAHIPNTRIFSEAMRFARHLEPTLVHENAAQILGARAGAWVGAATARVPFSLRAALVCDLATPVQSAILVDNLRQPAKI